MFERLSRLIDILENTKNMENLHKKALSLNENMYFCFKYPLNQLL